MRTLAKIIKSLWLAFLFLIISGKANGEPMPTLEYGVIPTVTMVDITRVGLRWLEWVPIMLGVIVLPVIGYRWIYKKRNVKGPVKILQWSIVTILLIELLIMAVDFIEL